MLRIVHPGSQGPADSQRFRSSVHQDAEPCNREYGSVSCSNESRRANTQVRRQLRSRMRKPFLETLRCNHPPFRRSAWPGRQCFCRDRSRRTPSPRYGPAIDPIVDCVHRPIEPKALGHRQSIAGIFAAFPRVRLVSLVVERLRRAGHAV